MNILFVCQVNKVRSRTAEALYSNSNRYKVKSAGIESTSLVKISAELIIWADMIFVMEEEHEEYIRSAFPNETWNRGIIILDIYDNYYYMEPSLIQALNSSLSPYLDQ